MTENPENTIPKQRKPGFLPGQSGNPKGKPKGARNKVLMALDEIGASAADEVLQAAVAAAKNGDVRAQELILSRIWPARRDRPISLPLPPISTAQDVSNAMSAVTAAAASGRITPSEGQAMATLLESHRKAIDLEARLAALEAGQSIANDMTLTIRGGFTDE